MGLWTLLEGCLLLANALAILNEDRFLAPRVLKSPSHSSQFALHRCKTGIRLIGACLFEGLSFSDSLKGIVDTVLKKDIHLQNC
ncbi:Unknown protein [Striga hermonthica]|uniref:Secreted protein n=1 Tax=Striga hermonthica TaxID=68872 RepID=A0A9N7NEZ0_STRHE|nr:Unknown protein [Striga hermonthica]